MEENLSLYHIFTSPPGREIFPGLPGNFSSASRPSAKLSGSWRKIWKPYFLSAPPGSYAHPGRRTALPPCGPGLRHPSVRRGPSGTQPKLGVSQLRIGASTTLCRYILLPHLKNFVRLHPHVKVSITCQSTFQTLALLDENKIDIGLVGEPSALRGTVFFPLLGIQDIFVAAPAYLENLSLREGGQDLYDTAAFMMLDEENITRQHINRSLRRITSVKPVQRAGGIHHGPADRISPKSVWGSPA